MYRKRKLAIVDRVAKVDRSRSLTRGCVLCEEAVRERELRNYVLSLFDHTIKHWVESLLRHASRAFYAMVDEAIRITIKLRDTELLRRQNTAERDRQRTTTLA